MAHAMNAQKFDAERLPESCFGNLNLISNKCQNCQPFKSENTKQMPCHPAHFGHTDLRESRHKYFLSKM